MIFVKIGRFPDLGGLSECRQIKGIFQKGESNI